MRLEAEPFASLEKTLDQLYFIAGTIKVIAVCKFGGIDLAVGPAADLAALKTIYRDKLAKIESDSARLCQHCGGTGRIALARVRSFTPGKRAPVGRP